MWRGRYIDSIEGFSIEYIVFGPGFGTEFLTRGPEGYYIWPRDQRISVKIIGRLRRPFGYAFHFPAPRAWMQILPYGQFASVARGGAIITSPFHGSVGIACGGLGDIISPFQGLLRRPERAI